MSTQVTSRFDDDADVDAFVFPDCIDCKLFNRTTRTCAAYPGGIPRDILEADAQHREVRADQKGAFVFTPDSE